MGRELARLLRLVADRLDPPPKTELFSFNNVTTTANTVSTFDRGGYLPGGYSIKEAPRGKD